MTKFFVLGPQSGKDSMSTPSFILLSTEKLKKPKTNFHLCFHKTCLDVSEISL